MDKKFYTTQEVADLLGISRVAVFKKIRSGEMKARKNGRNYIIARNDLPEALTGMLTKRNKELIEKAVKKTVREYGQTLKLLGQE